MRSEAVGQRDGLIVLVQTDDLGSHCIISGKSHLMLHCRNHGRAMGLAKRIVAEGFSAIGRHKWPYQSFDKNLRDFLMARTGAGL